MAKAKARRDKCTIFEARAKGYRWLAAQMGLDEKRCTIHLWDAQQCNKAIEIITVFALERQGAASTDTPAR